MVLRDLNMSDAIYVHRMPKTTVLVSTKDMLKLNRIRTHLNDKLCLQIPDNYTVPIHETSHGYEIRFVCPSARGGTEVQCAVVSDENKVTVTADRIHQRLVHFS